MNEQCMNFIEKLRNNGINVVVKREYGNITVAHVQKDGRYTTIMLESYEGRNGFEVFYQSKTNDIEETIREIESELI